MPDYNVRRIEKEKRKRKKKKGKGGINGQKRGRGQSIVKRAPRRSEGNKRGGEI